MTDFEKIFQQKYALTNNNAAQREAIDTIDGPVLVIAGPGTGKTQLLSTRIANILRQTDASPENILAMTFTDAGAENMRERLSTMIGTAAFKVNIHTYHSFANELIQNNRQYFSHKNLENQADDITKIKILQELLQDLPRNSQLSSAKPTQLLGVIGEMKKSLISPQELIEIAQENIRQQDAFHQEIKGLAPKPRGKLEEILPFFDQVLEAMTHHNAEVPATAKVGSNLGFYLAKLVEARAEALESGKSKPLNDWKSEFLNKKSKDGDFQIRDVAINKKLLEFAEIYGKYSSVFEAEKLYDFDDMILQAIEALRKNDDFRLTLQEKFQYILLDEYQDTNEAQAEIVRLLTDNDTNNGKPNILAVGDDDQAIMAFQGASKSNMIDFYRRFKPEDIKVINLTKNYRSHGDILTSAKNIAETIGGRLTKNLPINIEKNISAEGDFSNKESEIFRGKFLSQPAEFEWVSDKITQLISNNVKPSQIAVLAPKHAVLEDFAQYLTHKNIPTRYEKRENILKNPWVEKLTKIARLILAIRDKDEAAMAEIFPEMASFDFWKIPAQEVWQMSWRADSSREFWIESCLSSENKNLNFLGRFLVEVAMRSHDANFEEILDLILGTTEAKIETGENLRSPIRAAIEAQNPEEVLATISALTVLRDNLRQFSGENSHSIQDLVDFVNIYNDFEIKISNTNPHGNSEDAVQLMTAFASKGLEFEHTFLLSLNNKIWNSTGNTSTSVPMPLNLRFTNITDEGDDTRKRLLFVAMTRAKTHLYLTSFTSDFAGKNAPTLDYLDEREDSGELKTHILPEIYQKVNTFEKDSPRLDTIQINWHNFYKAKTPEMRELLKERLKKFKLAPTNLNKFTDLEYAGPQSFYEDTLLRFPSSYSYKAFVGTLVHDGFNWIQDEVNADRKVKFDNLKLRASEKLAKMPFSQNEKSKILEAFSAIFERICQYKISDFKKGNIAEKNFAFDNILLDNIPLTGKIDLIKIDRENKKITVLDYKTGSVPLTASNQINTRSSKIHKYEQQLYFYKILIENCPDFADFTVEKGVLEFVEPSSKTGEFYTHEIDFLPQKEENVKQLIAAVWQKIQNLDFSFDEEKFDKNYKGIIDFENFLITEFEAQK